MPSPFRSEAFDPQRQDTSSFVSREPSLDEWLREHAWVEGQRGHSRTWAWADSTSRVTGFYTLSAHKVARDDVPTRAGRGGPREIPAVLVGKLALHAELAGRGDGSALLADALLRIEAASHQVGARLIVVDALHEKVAAWYERFGFIRIPDRLLLVRRIADVVAAREVSDSPED
jgi:GNAT superfamily N-acetyltransferase